MVAALFAVAIGASGCASEGDAKSDGTAEQVGEIGATPLAAGIAEGSLEEEGVLLLANDRAVTADALEKRAHLTPAVARTITSHRTDADGKPQWFANVDAIDALPGTTKEVFQLLVADARASGYIEAPGFEAPLLAKIAVPPLTRPATANDVTVEAGFDGVPTAQALAVVRGRLTNTVHESNERFITEQIAATHKAFTLAVGNLFANSSPHATFAKALVADSITLIGTPSQVSTTILVAEKDGQKSYFARGPANRYESIPTPKYPVLMRARIRLATGAADDPGQGVRVFYPAWSAKVLTGPTTVITEGTE